MKKMTKKQAKKLCIEVWEYLRDHPEIKVKCELPGKIWVKIEDLACRCPLCEILDCDACPLQRCTPGLFAKWTRAETDKTRAKYASAIVEKVKAWKV